MLLKASDFRKTASTDPAKGENRSDFNFELSAYAYEKVTIIQRFLSAIIE